jgi:hypothetical protein
VLKTPLIKVLPFLPVSMLLHGAIASAAPPDLPENLVDVKEQIIQIATENTTRVDNIDYVRAQLDPLVEELGAWFNANRPENEVELTQVPWRNLWYDDPDIGFELDLLVISFELDRNQIYQVIEDGFYYNVSELVFRAVLAEYRFQSYLKGAYTIIREASAQNQGEARLNTVDLEFVDNRIQIGTIPRAISLSVLVDFVDTLPFLTVPIPGPLGVTGELWNVYVDDDLRIAAGFDDSEPERIDLYILRGTVEAGD